MTMAKPSKPPQIPPRTKHAGLPCSELDSGEFYRDVLSGFLVLVEETMSEGPDPSDVRFTVRTTHKVGRYWNPLYGSHQLMDLHDRQFIPAHLPYTYGAPFPVRQPSENT